MFKKYYLLFGFMLTLGYGVYLSIAEYYYSDFQKFYWSAIGVLVLLFFLSRISERKLPIRQLSALVVIAGLYFYAWYVIPYFHRFAIFGFASVCFLYAGTLLYNTQARMEKILFGLALGFSALNLAAVMFIIAEKTEITRPLVNTLFISNPKETQEYLSGKLSLLHLFLFVVYGYSVYLLLKTTKKSPDRKRLNLFVLPLFVLSFLMASLFGPMGFLGTEYYIHLRERTLFRKLADERKRNLESDPFRVISDSTSAQKVMVIIGESLNRDFMSIYGYPSNTTPELVKLSRDSTQGRLFHFTNIISPEATTVPALRVVLTSINNENRTPFEKCISLVDLFDRAGYESFWLSNQAPLGEYDTPNAVISASAHHTYFTASENSIGNKNALTGNNYDELLLKVFDKYASKFNTSKKQVFFIHLMGSHWSYSDRYPPQFDFFKSQKDNDPASYLNSVRYNDAVVSSLLRQAQAKKFDVVCYFSDHGEDMKFQHNQGNYQKSMSTIPLLVYLSDSYMKMNLGVKNSLVKNRDTPAMTDNFFQDIQAITGLQSSVYKPQDSFISDQYRIRKRKVVEGTIPFD